MTDNGVCSRTKAVACIKYMDREKWQQYILGRLTKGTDPKKTAGIISSWVSSFLQESIAAIQTLEIAGKADGWRTPAAAKLSTVLKRWNQIRSLCEDNLHATNVS